jgi:hypothetical protein
MDLAHEIYIWRPCSMGTGVPMPQNASLVSGCVMLYRSITTMTGDGVGERFGFWGITYCFSYVNYHNEGDSLSAI